jgi:hypothetical protein
LRAIAALTLLVTLFSEGLAQNIVFNSSFEDKNVCSELHQPCSPAAWFFVNRTGATGYFVNGYASASGSKNIRIIAANADSASRQYWETMLATPLVPGKKYKIGLKIAAPKIGPNLNDIGFVFTDSMIFSERDTLLHPGFYQNFSDAKITRLKNGWFEISKEITAANPAIFLIIGNFSRRSNNEILAARKMHENIVLLIDDVFVLQEQTTIYSGSYSRRKDSLYRIRARHSSPQTSWKPGSF